MSRFCLLAAFFCSPSFGHVSRPVPHQAAAAEAAPRPAAFHKARQRPQAAAAQAFPRQHAGRRGGAAKAAFKPAAGPAAPPRQKGEAAARPSVAPPFRLALKEAARPGAKPPSSGFASGQAAAAAGARPLLKPAKPPRRPARAGAMVGKLSLEGLQLLEEELIRPHIRLKPGEPYRLETARRDVRRLFELGFFEDIEAHARPLAGKKAGKSAGKKAVHVIYRLRERPMLMKLEFQGNKQIKSEDLRELSKIRESEFLQFKNLQKTLAAIRKKYREEGYFLAEISYRTEPLDKAGGARKSQKAAAASKSPLSAAGKRARLIIEIKEGQKILVRSVNFIGNREIPSKDLKAFMMTKERDIFSLLGAGGAYSPESLDRDLRAVEYFYRDKGYLNVRLEKPEISISPDKKGAYISIAVAEGPRFTASSVEFPGDKEVPAEKAEGRLALKEGGPFSLGALHRDLDFIRSLYSQKGYAFAEARPRIFPDPLRESAVRVVFEVEKGARYKVGRVEARGNRKIRDKALLRRLGLMEGELYDESRQKLAGQILRQMGYFEKTDFKLKRRPLSEGRILDIHLHVKEKENTGEFQAIGGYDNYTKLFVRLRLKNNSLFGLDQSLFLEMDFNRYQEILSFQYMNPYFLDTDWSFGFEVFNSGDSELSALGEGRSSLLSLRNELYASYSRVNTGFSFSFGRHLTPFFEVFLKYRLQKQSLSGDSLLFIRKWPVFRPVFEFLFGSPDSAASLPIFDDVYPLKEGEGLNSSLSGVFEHDRRDDRLRASKGHYSRASLEWSGLGGDFRYVKAHLTARRYQPLFWGMTAKGSFNYGIIASTEKGKPPLFTELFKLGGSHSLRGFSLNSVGPRKYSQKAYDYAVKRGYKNPKIFAEVIRGGSQMFFINGELEFPLIPKARLRGAVFLDAGETGSRLSFIPGKSLRANTGAGLRWMSPMGPISLDWGIPFQPRKEYGEKDIEFHFSMGSGF